VASPQLPESGVMAFEEGMSKLKTAAIIMIIAAILTGVGALTSIAAILSNFMASPASALAEVFGGIAVAGMLGGAIVLLATFLYLIKAFNKLKEFNAEKFSTPATIVKIGFLAYGVMTVIAPIAMYATVSQLLSNGIPGFTTVQQVIGILQTINALTYIARAAAMIGIGLGTYYIHEVTNEGLYLAAAVLFFIAILIPILAFIAWILVVVGADNAVNKIKAIRKNQTTPNAFTRSDPLA